GRFPKAFVAQSGHPTPIFLNDRSSDYGTPNEDLYGTPYQTLLQYGLVADVLYCPSSLHLENEEAVLLSHASWERDSFGVWHYDGGDHFGWMVRTEYMYVSRLDEIEQSSYRTWRTIPPMGGVDSLAEGGPSRQLLGGDIVIHHVGGTSRHYN